MNPLLRFLLSLTLFVCFAFGATIAALAGDEWRAIDPAELALKASSVEKDADAEALFWEVRVDDSQPDELSLRNYIRIKIFTERGKESESKIDLPYANSARIQDVAARVIKPDGSIVELKKQDVFDRTIVKGSGIKVKAKSFALPGVEPGAIIEYRWREVIPNGWANHLQLQFQREIPVRNVAYYFKPYEGMHYLPFNMGDSRFQKDKDGFFKYAMTNVPAFREEPKSPPEGELRSWVLLYAATDDKLDVEKYWKEYGKRVYESTKDLVKADGEIKTAVGGIIADAREPEEKLQRIYNFCRTRIKNINDDASGMSDDEKKKLKENKSPADTLKRGMGTGLDIDTLFAALAKAAGFDARIALSGNRDDFYFDRRLANSYFLGSSFIAVKVGETWEFFSPAEIYTDFGMLGWPEEGQEALILDPKDPIWVNTPMSGPEKSIENRTGKFKLLEDGTLEGDVRIEYSGHLGFDKKEFNDDDSPSQREQTLRDSVKRQMSTAELSATKIENVTDPLKPFAYEYHVRVPGYAQRTGKRLFLQPGYFSRGIDALFSSTQRKAPVYFHYSWSEKDHITIDLPAGFALDNADAPDSITRAMTQNICEQKIQIAITRDGQTLVYDRTFAFGANVNIVFPVEGYAPLKHLFELLKQNNDHTITLKQTAASASN